MKRLMMTIAVVVVLMGISDKASADIWRRCGLVSSGRFQSGGRQFLGRSFRIPSGSFRTPYGNVWNRCGLSSSGSGRNFYYGRDRSTLGKVLGYSEAGMNMLGGLNDISVTNRAMSMAEREQNFRHEQIRRIGSSTVLRTRVPIRRIIKPKKVQGQKSQEIQQLQQEKKELQIQLKKLQQELEAKK